MEKLKFSPCIEMIFKDVDFYDRFEKAKEAGLENVEFWGWVGRDLNKISEKCKENNITITSVCVGSTDKEINDKHNEYKLVDRRGAEYFYKACVESIEVAKKLNIPNLIITVGQELNTITRYEQHTNCVLALKKVAPLFEEAGITLIVEPLNVLCNHIGYFLPSSYEAFGIIEEVGSDNVKLLYDIYHQQISEGNLIPTITKYFDLIGHFHVADVPGRHEPGTGEINYINVFNTIKKLGYDKYVGFEYSPTEDTFENFKKIVNYYS